VKPRFLRERFLGEGGAVPGRAEIVPEEADERTALGPRHKGPGLQPLGRSV